SLHDALAIPWLRRRETRRGGCRLAAAPREYPAELRTRGECLRGAESRAPQRRSVVRRARGGAQPSTRLDECPRSHRVPWQRPPSLGGHLGARRASVDLRASVRRRGAVGVRATPAGRALGLRRAKLVADPRWIGPPIRRSALVAPERRRPLRPRRRLEPAPAEAPGDRGEEPGPCLANAARGVARGASVPRLPAAGVRPHRGR